MASQGVFAIDRGIWEHDIFAPAPFTEREAWMWLVSEAAWKPKRVRTPHGMVQLERGQLAHSQRFLAEKWQWDRSRVRNFLVLLSAEKMTTAQPRPSPDPATAQQRAQQTTVLTICNYDKYQFGAPNNEPSSRVGNERETIQNRPKEEEVINKKEESKKDTREAALSSDFEFEDFWNLWPNKVGKPAALRAFVSARKRAGLDLIVDGVFAYIRDKPPDRPWLNPATFLNQNRWEDQPAQVANGKSQDNPRSGSLIAAIDRRLAALAVEGEPDLAVPADNIFRISDRSVQRS